MSFSGLHWLHLACTLEISRQTTTWQGKIYNPLTNPKWFLIYFPGTIGAPWSPFATRHWRWGPTSESHISAVFFVSPWVFRRNNPLDARCSACKHHIGIRLPFLGHAVLSDQARLHEDPSFGQYMPFTFPVLGVQVLPCKLPRCD